MESRKNLSLERVKLTQRHLGLKQRWAKRPHSKHQPLSVSISPTTKWPGSQSPVGKNTIPVAKKLFSTVLKLNTMILTSSISQTLITFYESWKIWGFCLKDNFFTILSFMLLKWVSPLLDHFGSLFSPDTSEAEKARSEILEVGISSKGKRAKPRAHSKQNWSLEQDEIWGTRLTVGYNSISFILLRKYCLAPENQGKQCSALKLSFLRSEV